MDCTSEMLGGGLPYLMPRKKTPEEPLDHPLPASFVQFVPAESVYFVASQLQVSVLPNHLRVAFRTRNLPIGVVVFAVYFDHYSITIC